MFDRIISRATPRPNSRFALTIVAPLAALTITLAAACTAGDRATSGFAVRDTLVVHGGTEHRVEIAENPAPGPTLPTWRIAEDPDLALGGLEAEGELALFRVAGAFRLADGRIVVADGGSTKLKFFDPAGQLVGTAGGPGAGPGEFRSLRDFMRLPGDALVVWDLQQARLTFFDAAGELAETRRIATASGSPPGSVTGIFSDGSLLARGFNSRGSQVPDGLRRDSTALLHLAADGALADSLGAIPGGEIFYQAEDGGFSFYWPPFARSTHLVMAGNHLYLGDTGRPEIQVQRPDGTPVRLIRWAEPGRPVTTVAAEAARGWVRETNDSEYSRPHIERMLREVPLPERMPAFLHFLVDDDAHLWVAEHRNPWETGDTEWLVFGTDGRLTARIELPLRFRPTQIGTDFILGLATDEFDVEQVRLYRLGRG